MVPDVYDVEGRFPAVHTLVLRTGQFFGVPLPRAFARSRVTLDVGVLKPGSSSGSALPVVKVLGLLQVPEHRGAHLVSDHRSLDHGALQCLELRVISLPVYEGILVRVCLLGAGVRLTVLLFVVIRFRSSFLGVAFDP